MKEPKEQVAARKTQPKKPIPPDQTNAENFYYIKQMQSKTPMTIVLKDGEILHGVIEWYDKASLRSTGTRDRTCWSTNRTSSTCTRPEVPKRRRAQTPIWGSGPLSIGYFSFLSLDRCRSIELVLHQNFFAQDLAADLAHHFAGFVDLADQLDRG